jgi:hypothetical protein
MWIVCLQDPHQSPTQNRYQPLAGLLLSASSSLPSSEATAAPCLIQPFLLPCSPGPSLPTGILHLYWGALPKYSPIFPQEAKWLEKKVGFRAGHTWVQH